jgi:hypothetical protein
MSRFLLAIVAVGSVQAAHQDAKKVPTNPQEKTATAVAQQPAAKPGAKTELRLTVTGLTEDNVTKVKDSLTALSFQSYVCGCKYEQSTAGKCPKCNTDLSPQKKALFVGAMPSAEEGTIILTADPGHPVRFTEIENTLRPNSIQIPDVAIVGQAHLIVRNATEQDLPVIEKALREAKLFEEVEARFNNPSREIEIFVRCGTMPPPKRSVVDATIRGAAAKAMLSDVIWGRTKTI